MDEVILNVSERSLETQKDLAIVQVRVLEKHNHSRNTILISSLAESS